MLRLPSDEMVAVPVDELVGLWAELWWGSMRKPLTEKLDSEELAQLDQAVSHLVRRVRKPEKTKAV
jgi:hypothetical protein